MSLTGTLTAPPELPSEKTDPAAAEPPNAAPAPPPQAAVEPLPPPTPQPQRFRIEFIPNSRFYSLSYPFRVYDAATGELVGAYRRPNDWDWQYVYDPATGTYALIDGAPPPQLPPRPPWWDSAIYGEDVTPPP